MLTSTLQTALSVDPGTVVGAAVKVVAPGQTTGEDFAVTLDQIALTTDAPLGAEQEVQPDGTNATAMLLDLVLAQLPQPATIQLPTATPVAGSAPLAMVDLDQVKSNLQTVSDVVVKLGNSSQQNLAHSGTVHPAPMHLFADTGSSESFVGGEPSSSGSMGMVVEGAIGAIDVYELGDPAGSRPQNGGNGGFTGSRFQLDLTSSQATKLAQLVISGTNSSDVAANARDILLSSGQDFWAEVNTSDVSLIQSQIANLLNQEGSPANGNSHVAHMESNTDEPALVLSDDSPFMAERLIHDHRDGTQSIGTSGAVNSSATAKNEFVILSSEQALNSADSNQTKVSMKAILESVKAQVVTSQLTEGEKSTSSPLLSSQVLTVNGHLDELLSRGARGAAAESAAVADTAQVGNVKSTPVASNSTEVDRDSEGEDSNLETTAEFEPSQKPSEATPVFAEMVKESSSVRRPQPTDSVELRTAGLNKVAREVADLISARNPGRLTVRLNPDNLGTIDVSIKHVGRQLDVDMIASDDRVNHALRSSRAEMVQVLESKGVQVSSVSINREAAGFEMSQHHGQHEAADRRDFERAVNAQTSWHPATPTTTAAIVSNTVSVVDLQV